MARRAQMEESHMPGQQSHVNGHKHALSRQGKSRSKAAASRAQATQPESEPQRGRSAVGLATGVLLQAGKTKGAIEERRRHVAGRVTMVGEALRGAGEHLRSEHEAVSRYLDRAGQGVADVAQYIGSADLSSVRGDVQRLAREKPAWFVGGALVAGLVLGRLVKASSGVLPESEAAEGGRP
jgi:hypothetical protein